MNLVGIVSLGCSKNRVDSENILGLLVKAGFGITPHADKAEVIIVNTCGFIDEAKQESINHIIEMGNLKHGGACRLLVVTGCLSERYKAELINELPEVDLFWGVSDHRGLIERILALCGKKANGICTEPARLLTTPPYRAYLRIADGCDNRCSYCAIPSIRGPRKSVPMEVLIKEAQSLVKGGVLELTVIAQDTSAYGIDIYGKPMLCELLTDLSKIEGLAWIRVLYTYPDTVDERLIDTIVNNDKIVNYIDMPIQHIDPDILTAMNRRGESAHIQKIIDYIRHAADNFIIRSTVIVGFPGETEEQFSRLAEFVAKGAFDRLGAFAYSQEEGTKASIMPHQIPDAVKKARLHEIMSIQQAVSKRRNASRIGSVARTLIEGGGEGFSYGRSYAEAPEVDGMIMIGSGEPEIGSFVDVKITSASEYDVRGEML